MELQCLVWIVGITLWAMLMVLACAYSKTIYIRWFVIMVSITLSHASIFYIVKGVETARVKEPLVLNQGIFALVDQLPDTTNVSVRTLHVIPKGWHGTYAYRINCLEIRGGCPPEWPQSFEAFRDSAGKLNIVSLENHP